MRLPRFGVRALMAVVAVAAVGMGLASEVHRLWRRRAEYLERALVHGSRRQDFEDGGAGLRDEYVPYARRLHEYEAAMEQKYRAAASRPWLAVPPDPPRPEPK